MSHWLVSIRPAGGRGHDHSQCERTRAHRVSASLIVGHTAVVVAGIGAVGCSSNAIGIGVSASMAAHPSEGPRW